MRTHPLSKFLVLSVISFCIGTIHGMLQVMPSIRHWLDSIGSPYGGPGHMIDPLAHAHMNLVGGVVLLAMGTTYYLLPIFRGREIYSVRMVNHTFAWTSLGAYAFYFIQLGFGIREGLLLHSDPGSIPLVHRFYGPSVALAGTVMAVGFLVYLANIALTLRKGHPSAEAAPRPAGEAAGAPPVPAAGNVAFADEHRTAAAKRFPAIVSVGPGNGPVRRTGT
jgi:cytochrome c oxidase cbb3-type subunit 1